MQAPDPLARALSGEKNKERWNTWWILGWYVTTSAWVAIGLSDPGYGWGVLAFVVLFLPQELFALREEGDQFPPLTHVVRTRFPSWFAFPLIFATVTAVTSRWASLDWEAVGQITVPAAALGWLIEHFLATYAGPDPRGHGDVRAGGPRRAA